MLIRSQPDVVVGNETDVPMEKQTCTIVFNNCSDEQLMDSDKAASEFSQSVYFKQADIGEALRAEIQAYFSNERYELLQEQMDLFCSIWSEIDQAHKKKQLSKLEEEDDKMIKTLFENTKAHSGSIDQEKLVKELE